MEPLFEAILNLPKPLVSAASDNLQLLVANIAYDDFKGKLGIGRIHSGALQVGSTVAVGKPGLPPRTAKIAELFVFENLDRKPVTSANAGEIVMFSGVADVAIGETIANAINPIFLEPIAVSEPTVKMLISVNTSPLAGRDGKLLTRYPDFVRLFLFPSRWTVRNLTFISAFFLRASVV